MGLKEKLDAIREGASKRIPPEWHAIMHRAITDLRASGIMDRIVKVGQRMPAFSGTAHDGRAIRSGDLLSRGPLVLSFFPDYPAASRAAAIAVTGSAKLTRAATWN